MDELQDKLINGGNNRGWPIYTGKLVRSPAFRILYARSISIPGIDAYSAVNKM
jgi:hypothetical protein